MTGGGAATNSGIDFQHRVGALAMLDVLADIRLMGDDLGGTDIRELRFETADGIDDLVVVTATGMLLVQAKRSINLSSSLESEYSSVLRQFVDQYVRRPAAADTYLLATSNSASRKIRQDLRKLTEAVRLNETGSEANPLSRSEQAVLDTTSDLISRHFTAVAGRSIRGHERIEIIRRMRVVDFDIERDGALERAVLVVLASRTTAPPLLVWNSLIAWCMSLAKARLSISVSHLIERMSGYFLEKDAGTMDIDWFPELADDEELASGREVVLAELEDRMLLAELIRFSEDGSRRLRFADDRMELSEGTRLRVLRRTATMVGMMRLLSMNPELIADREVSVVGINSEEDFDGTPIAREHTELCRVRWQRNLAPLDCLACGRVVSDAQAQLIEIDEEGVDPAVGVVHLACVRPLHRVLGEIANEQFKSYPELKDFDYRAWWRTRPTGQGVFGSSVSAPVVRVGWKPSRHRFAVGDWGVAYELDDGSRNFLRQRGRVQRFSRARAEMGAAEMNDSFAAAIDRNDPYCVSARTGEFGTYALLLRQCGAPLLEVVTASPCRLDRATVMAHQTVENFYAPLVVPVDADRGEPFEIAGAVVMLSDPLALVDSVANWAAAGMDPPPLSTVVLESDDQFDALVASSFLAGMGVLVDPLFDRRGELVSACVIENFEALAATVQ